MSATPPTYDVYPRVPCDFLAEGGCIPSSVRCRGCRGDGTRSDLDNGIPVERRTHCDEDHDAAAVKLSNGEVYALPDLACCFDTAGGVFVPVSSTEENPQ